MKFIDYPITITGYDINQKKTLAKKNIRQNEL